VNFFAEHRDCHAICIHGCDHTNDEFGGDDYRLLLDKAHIAGQRMRSLSQQTGLDYDRLMVFPQNHFSHEAIRALADSQQAVASVNSTCLPVNRGHDEVRFGDLLLPCVDRFHGFPLFMRYGPTATAEFALSLFVGRPVILEEHHQFFHNGCEGIEAFTSRMNKLDPTLHWERLAPSLQKVHWVRQITSDVYEIRFFTTPFLWTNDRDQRITCRFIKRVAGDSVLQVLVNGHPTPFSSEGDFVEVTVFAEPKTDYQLELVRDRIPPSGAYPKDWRYQAGVRLRRRLSELRDNVLSRNQAALQIGQGAVDLLGFSYKSRKKKGG
jgi:hypothetical protein